ncbi:uncharacterized protein LOC121807995 [Salvia splendens]|uniref:uncharacterized protein LOC121807995 n=1 Tax=Salvia splendens TaxID=180675 RepID=UPI001C25F352|nr:uncharacterized protein LOC121807995 [Salvia splendens]
MKIRAKNFMRTSMLRRLASCLLRCLSQMNKRKNSCAETRLTLSDSRLSLHSHATMLFKTLCLKLDALSHFHFCPKPVIQDKQMSLLWQWRRLHLWLYLMQLC